MFGAEIISHSAVDDELKNDIDFLTNVTRTNTLKVVGFGKGSISHGRDSRYWDKDDRRRDDDYSEDILEHASMAATDKSIGTGHASVKVDSGNEKLSVDDPHKGSDRKGVGLYNEAGRNELKMYEAEYEASLKNAGLSGNLNGNENQQSGDKIIGVNSEPIDVDDEYDDNVEFHDTRIGEYDDSGHDKGDHSDVAKIQNQYQRESSDLHDAKILHQNIVRKVEEVSSNLSVDSSLKSQNLDKFYATQRQVSLVGGQSTKASPKKKSKRRKFLGKIFVSVT